MPERRRSARRPGRGGRRVLPRLGPAGQRRARPRAGARARAPAAAAGEHRDVAPQRHRAAVQLDGESFELDHGHVVIAAITSCTNTSNPSVMIGAGILARNAVARGLRSQAVGQDLARAGLEGRHRIPRPRRPDRAARALGFNLVGYGCTTCIGNSGPLPQEISEAVGEGDLAVVSVLSGNRNFEGRINPDVKMNYLASPPLCVAYALVGHDGHRHRRRAARHGRRGQRRLPADIWPSEQEIAETVGEAVQADMFRSSYGEVFDGDERWNGLEVPGGRALRLGRELDLRAPAALLRGHARRARGRHRRERRARARAARRQRHHRPHLAGRRDQARRSRRALPAGAGRRGRATSTPTARAAATTR